MKVTPTIFYVDDDSDDLSFFKEAAENLDADVQLFPLGDDMMEALRHPPPAPSVIFVDLNMPKKNGFEVMQEIRQMTHYKQVPIVVLSTACSKQTVDKCKSLGASYYVQKPSSVPKLKAAILHVLKIDWKHFVPDSRNYVYKNA